MLPDPCFDSIQFTGPNNVLYKEIILEGGQQQPEECEALITFVTVREKRSNYQRL